jgi:hypothetical protein
MVSARSLPMTGKTLLDVKMPTISHSEARALIENGKKLTLANLYEPEHAPAGTQFVLVDFGKSKVPYRIR